MTIGHSLSDLESELKAVSDTPRLEAERLLLQVMGQRDSSWLYAHASDEVSSLQRAHLDRLAADRLTGRPLAYVLGEWDFLGRGFMVDARVLVPRPETEELVQKAIDWIQTHPEAKVVADIGTGSGVIAVSLALELAERSPAIEVLATDISPAALEVARENARRHRVEDKIEFLLGDMLEPLQGRKIDLIVSNPPYVPSGEVDEAGDTPETLGLRFEPRLALDGGIDGQVFVNKITASGLPAVMEVTSGRIVQTNF